MREILSLACRCSPRRCAWIRTTRSVPTSSGCGWPRCCAARPGSCRCGFNRTRSTTSSSARTDGACSSPAAAGRASGTSPEFKHSGLIESVAFSPDTARVLTGSGGKAQLWDAITGEKLFAVPGAGSLNSAKFSPDGRRLVTASEDNTAQVWDALTGKPEGGPLPHRSWVYHAAFSPESRHVVPDSYDKSAQIWDAATGRAVRLPFLQPGDSSTGMIQCHHGWTRMVAEPNSGAFTPSP